MTPPPKFLAPPIIGLLWFVAGWFVRRALGLSPFVPTPWHLAGWVLVAAGLSVPILCVKRFRKAGTTEKPWATPAVFVREGLYRYSRNPMYLGMATALVGGAVLLRTPEMFAVPFLFLLTLNFTWVPFEERTLSARFGEAYDAYRHRVRRWL